MEPGASGMPCSVTRRGRRRRCRRRARWRLCAALLHAIARGCCAMRHLRAARRDEALIDDCEPDAANVADFHPDLPGCAMPPWAGRRRAGGRAFGMARLSAWLRLAGAPGQEGRGGVAAKRGANPYISRLNHRIEEAIAAAVEREDFAPFHEMGGTGRALRGPAGPCPLRPAAGPRGARAAHLLRHVTEGARRHRAEAAKAAGQRKRMPAVEGSARR